MIVSRHGVIERRVGGGHFIKSIDDYFGLGGEWEDTLLIYSYNVYT